MQFNDYKNLPTNEVDNMLTFIGIKLNIHHLRLGSFLLIFRSKYFLMFFSARTIFLSPWKMCSF